MWPFKTTVSKPPDKQTPHHYILAHLALRQVALGNPYGFFGVMGSPQRQEFLDDLWKQICQNCDKDGAAFFTSRDIRVHTTRIGEYPAVLVEMPPAYFTAEAHMVCAVLKNPLSGVSANPENPSVWFFTLEKGEDVLTGQDRTVLCAWDGETHVNYGDGPEATPGAFIEKIKGMIEPDGPGYGSQARRT
jgi:hypothetical protein